MFVDNNNNNKKLLFYAEFYEIKYDSSLYVSQKGILSVGKLVSDKILQIYNSSNIPNGVSFQIDGWYGYVCESVKCDCNQ